MLSNLTINTLSDITSPTVSKKTLERSFHKLLAKPPIPDKTPRKDKPSIYIKIDATYFGRWGCLVLYKDSTGKFVYGSFVKYETFLNYRYDLQIIKGRYKVLGTTSDWHGSLVAAVKHTLPNIPHQRCLVHTQRRCETLLTRNPKTIAGVELLKIVKDINKIKTQKEANKWLYRIYTWSYKYEHLTLQRSYGLKEDGSKTWWYTHKNLRSAYRTIINTQNNLFLYISDKHLVKDTNGLEGEFSHLKHKLRSHRGLTKQRKVSAMFWYLYFKNQERNN